MMKISIILFDNELLTRSLTLSLTHIVLTTPLVGTMTFIDICNLNIFKFFLLSFSLSYSTHHKQVMTASILILRQHEATFLKELATVGCGPFLGFHPLMWGAHVCFLCCQLPTRKQPKPSQLLWCNSNTSIHCVGESRCRSLRLLRSIY